MLPRASVVDSGFDADLAPKSVEIVASDDAVGAGGGVAVVEGVLG